MDIKDVLIVEDNRELGTLLRDFLEAEGYTVELIENGNDALDFFERESVRLLLLDIMLPGVDGFTICKKVREKSDTPIIMLSAKVEKEDKVNGLLLGADDYMEKPYDIDILLAKVKTVFRRYYDNKELSAGGIHVDCQARTVQVRGTEIELTAKEYELLVLLMENKGKVLQKEWIFNRIWGCDSFSEQQTLTVHIKWLREKIENNPKKPEHIITAWGVGYRFEGE